MTSPTQTPSPKKNPIVKIAGLVIASAVLALILIGAFTSPMDALEPSDDERAALQAPPVSYTHLTLPTICSV